MFRGIGHHRQIVVTGQPASSSGSALAKEAKLEVDHLKFEVERLLMITEALWDILKEQHGYSDEELIRRVGEIDMRDGKMDGKVAPSSPEKCPKCGRTLAKRRSRCIYCGEDAERSPFSR